MKLLLVFAFLALICMVRSAPSSSSTSRSLIYSSYDDDEEISNQEVVKPQEDDDDSEETTPTTTTTTTRRSSIGFPTRNRNLIPSRRPIQTQPTFSIRTTTPAFADDDDDDQETSTNAYDGDFRYIRDFRKYFQKLMDDIRKLVRNLTGYDFASTTQRQQYNQNDE